MNFYNREETQFHLLVCIKIKQHLLKKYNIIARREWYIILDDEEKFVGIPTFEITLAQKSRKERYRNPDLVFRRNGMQYIIEVDGYVHYTKSAKTNRRNEIYHNNDCTFIILNTYEINSNGTVKNRTIENIIKELDAKLNGEIV